MCLGWWALCHTVGWGFLSDFLVCHMAHQMIISVICMCWMDRCLCAWRLEQIMAWVALLLKAVVAGVMEIFLMTLQGIQVSCYILCKRSRHCLSQHSFWTVFWNSQNAFMAQFSADEEAGSRSSANTGLTHIGGSWVAYPYVSGTT